VHPRACAARPRDHAGQVEDVILQRERGVRHHVHVVRLDAQTFRGRDHSHRGLLRQDLRQQTLMRRIEVLDHNERHPTAGRGRRQKL
jgi:hypothetical protein